MSRQIEFVPRDVRVHVWGPRSIRDLSLCLRAWYASGSMAAASGKKLRLRHRRFYIVLRWVGACGWVWSFALNFVLRSALPLSSYNSGPAASKFHRGSAAFTVTAAPPPRPRRLCNVCLHEYNCFAAMLTQAFFCFRHSWRHQQCLANCRLRGRLFGQHGRRGFLGHGPVREIHAV